MPKKTNEDEDSMFYEDLDEDEDKEESEEPKKKQKKKKEESNTALYIVVGIIIVVAVVLIVLYADKLFPSQAAPKNTGVAATVNGKEILLSEVDKQYNAIPESYRTLYPKTVVLDQLISRELLLQEAASRGISTGDDQVSEVIASMKAQFPSEEEFTSLLSQQNLTVEDLSQQLKVQLTISKLLNESVFKTLAVTDDEIKAYFDANAADQNVTLDQVSEQIRTIILFDKQKDAYNRFVDDLKAKATIVNLLNTTGAPPPPLPASNATQGDAEAAACAKDFGLTPQTVIYYTASADWCTFCKEADTAVNKLISEGKNFHIADITVKVGLDVVNTCFKAKMREGVPQFICAGSGQIKAGSLTEQELRSFMEGCG